jgi:hypothetical protein
MAKFLALASWFTRKRILIFFGIGIIVVTGVVGYFTYQWGHREGYETGHSTVVTDKPYLSESEAIGIAKQHSLMSTASIQEKRAALYFQRIEGSGGYNDFNKWKAQFEGDGKWLVVFRVLDAQKPNYYLLYGWTVFEKTLTAVFIQEFSTPYPP